MRLRRRRNRRLLGGAAAGGALVGVGGGVGIGAALTLGAVAAALWALERGRKGRTALVRGGGS